MKTPLLLLMFAAGPALAADADLLRCRALTEAGARLACYDAISVGAKAPAAAPVTREAQAASFGIEQTKVGTDQPEAIETSIKGYFEGWRPNLVITLANGQVWRVVDDSEGSVDATNPRVVLRRGAMGAVYMEFDKTNKSPRVRRIR